ncbi:cytochrome c-type biogenesis protein [Deinococcus daejeonensis]|uniref:Cytochrome c-type biogenesis protein n=1 Tax=Deinococcus daejeonensis TaxID=1007098 RepID=A0ABQ2J0K9_9DEIO|nr:cytochrome c-type biogenesis protein CcmH [Deinococcus daejeonensis]GGN33633.1 cytochrome c biogenesis protein [Deinococcus daejeonensis]
MRRALLLTGALLGATAVAQTAPTPSLTPAQEARALAIEKNLRCPLCDTGESIADSRSTIAVKMRESVREQVAAGRGDSDIYVYFSQRYGNFVLLDPPKSGRNLLLWGAPLAALAAGGGVLWAFLRRSRPAATLPDEPLNDAGGFDPYLAQVQRDTRRGGDS